MDKRTTILLIAIVLAALAYGAGKLAAFICGNVGGDPTMVDINEEAMFRGLVFGCLLAKWGSTRNAGHRKQGAMGILFGNRQDGIAWAHV